MQFPVKLTVSSRKKFYHKIFITIMYVNIIIKASNKNILT